MGWGPSGGWTDIILCSDGTRILLECYKKCVKKKNLKKCYAIFFCQKLQRVCFLGVYVCLSHSLRIEVCVLVCVICMCKMKPNVQRYEKKCEDRMRNYAWGGQWKQLNRPNKTKCPSFGGDTKWTLWSMTVVKMTFIIPFLAHRKRRVFITMASLLMLFREVITFFPWRSFEVRKYTT